MSDNTKYKYRDIKVFGSTEWLANNEKNYRQVFDASEVSYVYCEVSFFNKLFDEQDWELKLELKCFGTDNKEICSLNCDRTIRKDENIIYVREGWGVKEPGTYWKRGAYRWEAHVDGKFLAEKYFYIEQEGTVLKDLNPYLEPTSIHLYEGPDSNTKETDRKYFKVFNGADTRYVWCEFTADNLVKNRDHWACELIFHFKTKTGQLIGKIEKLIFVYPQDNEINCTVGWGSEKKGTWAYDDYLIHVIFMNQLIAVVPFTVGYDYVEADDHDFIDFFPPEVFNLSELKEIGTVEKEEEVTDANSLEEVLEEFNRLIGLETIKRKVREYTNYLKFIKLRREKGLQDTDKVYLHAVFKGNPGTGKTTVARMLGKIYKQMGLLSKGHVHEVDRGDLVAEYIGQTAPKTKEVIKKARGGVLFIDEAYSLARKDDDSKDFGKEAIEVILKEMSDGPGDLAVVVAGYPEQMETFLNSNPGLKSRFTVIFDFPDYLPQELQEIALYTAEKKSVSMDQEAQEFLYKKLVEGYRNRTGSFGNARYVNSIIDEAKMNLGLRIMQNAKPDELTKEQLSNIVVDDLKKIFVEDKRGVADIPIDEDLLRDSLNALHSMIGLTRVKEEIDELVKLVRFYRETGKDLRKSFSLHSVFTGNPGTGKTTVARILAQIFKALGILERGQLVECDRQSMVGGFVGQTAIKTGELVDRAMGGVLFIDEAYSLTEGGQGDYGKEAIEVLLKRMEDHRGEFIVIAAGYTQNMERFLESNPGLKSRFDRVFQFEDYSVEEMVAISDAMFAENNVTLDKKAHTHMAAYIEHIYVSRDKFFGNGRAVRKIVESILKRQHLRLAQTEQEKRTPKMIQTITLADVEYLKIDPNADIKGGGGIGFKRS